MYMSFCYKVIYLSSEVAKLEDMIIDRMNLFMILRKTTTWISDHMTSLFLKSSAPWKNNGSQWLQPSSSVIRFVGIKWK